MIALQWKENAASQVNELGAIADLDIYIVDDNGRYIFRDIIYNCLKKNEDVHYNFLINHFKNHLNPFL